MASGNFLPVISNKDTASDSFCIMNRIKNVKGKALDDMESNNASFLRLVKKRTRICELKNFLAKKVKYITYMYAYAFFYCCYFCS